MTKPIGEMTLAEVAAEIHEAVPKLNLPTPRAMEALVGMVRLEVMEKGYYAGKVEVVPGVRGF